MIKNEKQYKITKKALEDWQTTYHESCKNAASGTPDWVHKAQIAGVKVQIRQLEQQLKEYEAIKSGKRKLPDLDMVNDISSLLVKWRIRCNLTQKELAGLVEMPEQQIQRYEETNYQSASLGTVTKVANVLRTYKGHRPRKKVSM